MHKELAKFLCNLPNLSRSGNRRSDQRGPHPFSVVSAQSDPDDLAAGMARGGDHYRHSTALMRSGVITGVSTGATSVIVSNGTVSSSVTVIVNRTASASSDGDNSGDGTPADETPTDPVVAAIENAASDTVALSQQEAPVVSSDALNALRTNNKTLVVNGDGYSLRFVGSSIKNTSAPVDTALTFTPSEHGVNFVLNNGEALPGTVEITFTGDYAAYSRIYLYNTVASKWQFLNAFKDNTLGADTAGEYLLTTENLRFAEMDWTFFIAGGFVMVGIVVAYIVVKKRYWFW